MQKETLAFGRMELGRSGGPLRGAFPNKGLKYPKTNEKRPSKTWKQIERQIGQGSLSSAEQQDLWDCLFLTMNE